MVSRRGSRAILLLSNLGLGLSLLGHLWKATTAGVDKPIADLRLVSSPFIQLIALERPSTDLANRQTRQIH